MKKRVMMIVLLVCLVLACQAGPCQAGDDERAVSACKHCGMDLSKLSHSRMLVTYDDGTTTEVCSVRCLAVDLSLSLDRRTKTVLVGDYDTKKLIKADKAVWVVGGSKPGVMTKRAKWAFAKRSDAQAFVKKNGGQLSIYEHVLKGAYEDMCGDTNMIREKRKMKKMQHM